MQSDLVLTQLIKDQAGMEILPVCGLIYPNNIYENVDFRAPFALNPVTMS